MTGNLRFYLFFAIFLGILIYALTLSKACVIIVTVILNAIKMLFKIIWKLLILPGVLVKKLLFHKNRNLKTKKSLIKNPAK